MPICLPPTFKTSLSPVLVFLQSVTLFSNHYKNDQEECKIGFKVKILEIKDGFHMGKCIDSQPESVAKSIVLHFINAKQKAFREFKAIFGL